jgi:hypothetical protein
VQIVGRVDVDEVKPKKKLNDKPYPEIREGASFLQVTRPRPRSCWRRPAPPSTG